MSIIGLSFHNSPVKFLLCISNTVYVSVLMSVIQHINECFFRVLTRWIKFQNNLEPTHTSILLVIIQCDYFLSVYIDIYRFLAPGCSLHLNKILRLPWILNLSGGDQLKMHQSQTLRFKNCAILVHLFLIK